MRQVAMFLVYKHTHVHKECVLFILQCCQILRQ